MLALRSVRTLETVKPQRLPVPTLVSCRASLQGSDQHNRNRPSVSSRPQRRLELNVSGSMGLQRWNRKSPKRVRKFGAAELRSPVSESKSCCREEFSSVDHLVRRVLEAETSTSPSPAPAHLILESSKLPAQGGSLGPKDPSLTLVILGGALPAPVSKPARSQKSSGSISEESRNIWSQAAGQGQESGFEVSLLFLLGGLLQNLLLCPLECQDS